MQNLVRNPISYTVPVAIIVIYFFAPTFALSVGIVAEKLSPPDSIIYACSPLPVSFGLWFADDTLRILWINTPINNSGDYGYSTLRDTLVGRGFKNTEAGLASITLTDSLCSLYNVIVFGHTLPRDLSASEELAVDNFVSAGGGLFAVSDQSTNTTRHSAITDAFGITFIGGIDFVFQLSLHPHPTTTGVSEIWGNGVMELGTSGAASCIGDFSWLFTTRCGLAASEFGDGRTCAVFDELLFVNNYTVLPTFDGITDPFHLQFARNLFDWLARKELRHLDTASVRVSVNGVTIDISDSRLAYADSVLTFTPSPDWSPIETVTVCLDSAADAIGNSIDSSICTYFIVDRTSPLIQNTIPWDGSEIDDNEFPVTVQITEDFCDTMVLWITIDGQYFTPDSIGCGFTSSWLTVDPVEFAGHWSEGDIDVCVHAEDICPDTCGPNISDSCWSFAVNTCRMAIVWLECPIPTSHTSCDTPFAVFGIQDTADGTIDTSAIYFTLVRIHTSGAADTFYISAPDPYLILSDDGDSLWAKISCPAEDGDTITVRLDSIYTEEGCLTIPESSR